MTTKKQQQHKISFSKDPITRTRKQKLNRFEIEWKISYRKKNTEQTKLIYFVRKTIVTRKETGHESWMIYFKGFKVEYQLS